MSYSNSQPRRELLENTLKSYLTAAGRSFSDEHINYLSSTCIEVDSVCRKALTIAMTDVSEEARMATIFSFSPSLEISPSASKIGEDIYRISMPVGLVQQLIETAPSSQASTRCGYEGIRRSSVIYAAITAFAHELNHLFVGHMEHPDSPAQEFDADFKAGMLMPVWGNLPDFQPGLKPGQLADSYLECLMGFLHLCSLFRRSDDGNYGLYFSPKLRFYTMTNGLLFACKQKLKQESAEEEILARLKILPALFGHSESALGLRELYAQVTSGLTDEESAKLDEIDRIRQREKAEWYSNSTHVRPIARHLKAILNRD